MIGGPGKLALLAAGILATTVGAATASVAIDRQFVTSTPLAVEDSGVATTFFLAQVAVQAVLPWLMFAGLAVGVGALALAAVQAGSDGAGTRTRMAPASVVAENPTTLPKSSPSSSNSSSRSSWAVNRDAVK